MKKSVSILMVSLCFACMASAQNATLLPLAAGDTVVNTATVNKAVTLVTAGYSATGVQYILNKISGTVAGTCKFQGSLNGTEWEDIGSAYTNTDIAKNSKVFTISNGVPYTYLRLQVVGSGTMSGQIRVYYVNKKYTTN